MSDNMQVVKALKIIGLVLLLCGALLAAAFFGVHVGYTGAIRHLDEIPIGSEFQSRIVVQTSNPRDTASSAGKQFVFSNKYISLRFNYPIGGQYVVRNYEHDGGDLKSFHFGLINTNEGGPGNPILGITVVNDGYCYLSWCGLQAKEAFNLNGIEWEYLGSTSYADVGELFTFNNLYRAREDGFSLYVVTHDKIDLNAQSETSDAFKSLSFTVFKS